MKSLRFVGLDVHKETILIAVANERQDAATVLSTIRHDVARLIKMLLKLTDDNSISGFASFPISFDEPVIPRQSTESQLCCLAHEPLDIVCGTSRSRWITIRTVIGQCTIRERVQLAQAFVPCELRVPFGFGSLFQPCPHSRYLIGWKFGNCGDNRFHGGHSYSL